MTKLTQFQLASFVRSFASLDEEDRAEVLAALGGSSKRKAAATSPDADRIAKAFGLASKDEPVGPKRVQSSIVYEAMTPEQARKHIARRGR